MRKLYSLLFSIIFISSSFAQVPTNGLVSEWLFDNGSLTNGSNSLLAILGGSPTAAFAADRNGNANSAINVNPGGFINFAGDEFDNVTTGANAQFSFSFWIKVDAFDNAYKCIFAKAMFESTCQIPGRQFAVLITPTAKLQFQGFGTLTGGNQIRVDGDQSLSVGVFATWHHVVISVDVATWIANLPGSTGVKMYLDGVLQNNTVSEFQGQSLSATGMQNGPAHFGFGTYLNSAGASCASSQNIDAHFDDFRIYDRILDASDVANLLNEGCDPNVVQIQPQSGSACSGNVSLFCQAFFGTVTEMRWEWYNGTAWQDMGLSTTGNTLSVGVDNNFNGRWRVKMTRDCGAVVYSDEAVVAVGEPYIASQTEGTSGSPVFLCPANGSVELSAEAMGENVAYQWYSAPDGFPPLSFQSISGATDPTYDAINGSTYYRVEVTACGQTVTSEDIYVFLAAQPTINIINVSNGGTICLGGSATMTISTSNVGQASWEPNNGIPLGAQAYSVSPSQTTTYTVTGTNSQSGCTATASTVITVNEQTAIVNQPLGATACEGEEVVLSVSASGSNLSYQWKKDGQNIPSANSSSFSIASVTVPEEGDYTVAVSGACGSENSSVAVLTVNEATAIVTEPVSLTDCEGEDVSFNVVAAGTSLTYQWYLGTSPVTDATSSTLDLSAVSANQAGDYTVEVSGICGMATSGVAQLTVNPLPDPSIAENAGVLETGTFDAYQWFVDGNLIPNANGSTYAPTVDGNYTVQVTQEGCTSTSEVYVYTGISTGVERTEIRSMEVFPNPFSSELIIEVAEPTVLTLYNVLGETVMSVNVNTRVAISTEALPAGVYLLRDAASTSVLRVVKN